MHAPGSSTTAFAKSTRPEIGGVVQREALFDRLDGPSGRTVAWISAPPGFGKTTLAASYLEARSYQWAWYQVDPDDDDGETFFHYLAHAVRRLRRAGEALPSFAPEHRTALPAFARRWFRALFAGAAAPIALALDDVHALSPDSPLLAILDAGLAQVPRQCCVIVTSRSAPPSILSRLQLAGQMVTLGPEELKISDAEFAEMQRFRGGTLTPALLHQLNERAEGWAAALVLMIEYQKLAGTGPHDSVEATPRAVFDYLAGQIFQRFDGPTRRLLLQVACLPRVTTPIAEAISGDSGAARILFNLAHNDYFVREIVGVDGRVFVLHPLLREFLLQRATRELPAAVDAAALRRAAQLLQQSGQAEDALSLYVGAADWAGVAELVLAEGDTLLGQGRHAALAAWLEMLPPPMIADDPRLLRAQGEALAQASPRVARRRFEDAFRRARDTGATIELVRCCVGVVGTILREFDDLAMLDRWLAEYEACTDDAKSATPPTIVFARICRQPGRTSSLQDVGLGDGDGDGDGDEAWRAELASAVESTLNGEFAAAGALAARADAPDGGAAATLHATDALRLVLDGRFDTAQEVVRVAIETGGRDAVRGYDVWLRLLWAAAAIGKGDGATARRELDVAESACTRRGDRALLHLLLAALAELEGDATLALREGKSAALLAVEVGLPWVECLARCALAQRLATIGETTSAQGQLRGAEAIAATLGSPLLRLTTLFTAAAVLQEPPEAGVIPLQQALSLAQALGAQHVPGVRPALLGALCASALQRGIGVEQARTLISAARIAPPADALRLRQWPWAFQVTTLGGFALQRAGEPLEFSAKGPGRPVELLKVLVALGAQNVRADQLADALWPHVDADYAHKSFTATLHRLRRIFGGDDTLRLSDGRLSLNGALFWVDAWALDHVLAAVDTLLRESAIDGPPSGLRSLLDEVLALYRGPFLADSAEQPAYLARREQLRGKVLRAVTRAARRWESHDQNDLAVDFYLRCIDADEQCEAFYRNLMLCYQRGGETGEARAVYARLQTVLAALQKSEPAAETKAVFAGLGG